MPECIDSIDYWKAELAKIDEQEQAVMELIASDKEWNSKDRYGEVHPKTVVLMGLHWRRTELEKEIERLSI